MTITGGDISKRRKRAISAEPTFGLDLNRPDRQPKTLGLEAYQTLRREILSGRLPPDTKLRFRSLEDRYGFGLTALRESLSRLSSDRLVTFEPLRGYRVAPTSIEELKDICSFRIEIAAQGLRDAIKYGDETWESDILASLHLLTRSHLPSEADDFDAIEKWEVRHEAFHVSLISACASPWRIHVLSLLSSQFERYRRHILLGMAASAETARRVDSEHEAIASLAISRMEDEAVAALSSHFRGSLDFLVKHYTTRSSS